MICKKKIAALLAAFSLTLSCAACAVQQETPTETTAVTAEAMSKTYGDMFTARDKETGWDEETAVHITLADAGSAADGDGVTVSGGNVTITGGGVYVLSGALSDGSVTVDAGDEKPQLVLNGVSVTKTGGAALYVKSADKVFVTLAPGSENALESVGAFTGEDGENVDACVFSKEDITFNGGGSLTVTSEAGHGIVSKDSLIVTGGTCTVSAGRHGFAGKDDIRILDGSFTVTCGKDAFHASNADDDTLGFLYIEGGSFEIEAADDAFHADSELLINGGKINVTACYEGLEGNTVTVNGGDIYIKAGDDGVNAAGGNDASGTANGGDAFGKGGGMPGGGFGMMDTDASCSLEVNGGTLTLNAEGDGLDSNGSILVSGGAVYISGPTNGGNGALDYGTGAVITGGTVIAAGASGMAENFGSASTQCSVLVSLSGKAGETLTLTDADGNVLAEYAPEKSYQCAVISAPGLTQGETYTVKAGETEKTVTLNERIYSEVQGMGGFGGGRGNNNGEAPQQPGGEPPTDENGEFSLPDGMPGFSGEAPQQPGGELPTDENGEFSLPDGMPGFSGEAPQRPDGEPPTDGNGSFAFPGNMPGFPGGGPGSNGDRAGGERQTQEPATGSAQI